MKNVIIISDTHDNTLPTKLKNDLKKCDIIIHSGDFTTIDYYEKLFLYNKKLYAVLGNMDKNELEEILSLKKTFTLEGKNFALMHGWGDPKNLHKKIEKEFIDYDWDVLIFGHSHSPTSIYKNNKLILNPGSPTDKRFASQNSYIKMQIENKKIRYEFIKI